MTILPSGLFVRRETLLRVAFVVPSIHRDRGIDRIASLVAHELDARGHEVAIVKRLPSDEYAMPIAPTIEVHTMHSPRGGVKGLKNIQLPLVVSSLRAHLKRFAPDVIIGTRWDVTVFALIAARPLGIPVVVWENNYLPAVHRSLPWRLLRSRTYRRAGAFVVVNEASIAKASEFVPRERIVLIPNFAAPSNAKPSASAWENFPGPRPRGKIIGLGRLSHEKGFDQLLDAFAKVANSYPDWAVAVVGRGPEHDNLEALIDSLSLRGRAALVGSVTDPVPTLLDSDVLVVPSRHEGFPSALVEAMSNGLACVAFTCPAGPREIIRDGIDGLLVPEGDTGAMAQALRRVMDDDALRQRLGEAATSVKERFSTDRIMREWIALLGSLVAKT